MTKQSSLEREFATRLIQLGSDLPPYVTEYQFYKPRKWRFDVAFLAPYYIAVEIEGGVYKKSRHTTGKGFEADCHKYNRAAVEGWILLRFTGGMIRDDPAACIAMIRQAIDLRRLTQHNVHNEKECKQ